MTLQVASSISTSAPWPMEMDRYDIHTLSAYITSYSYISQSYIMTHIASFVLIICLSGTMYATTQHMSSVYILIIILEHSFSPLLFTFIHVTCFNTQSIFAFFFVFVFIRCCLYFSLAFKHLQHDDGLWLGG